MNQVILKPFEYDALTRIYLPTFIERVVAELNPATPYLDNFHIHKIAAELEATRHGEVSRLAICVPPRNLKSIIASVAFPAWLLGHDPTTKIICVSYSQELADNLARQCRQVMQSNWYQSLFPKTRLSSSPSAVHDFGTTAGGSRKATSVEGTLTGLGADDIIIDDPVNAEEALSDSVRNKVNQWYRNSLITRLNDKKSGCIIIVMQRLHVDDLVGHVQQLEPWKIVSLAAIAPATEEHIIETPFGKLIHRRKEGEALHPEREPLSVLQSYRRTQGEEIFSAQFQQAPVAPGGNLIKVDQFQRFDLNAPPDFERIVQSWDTAYKPTQLSDFSVCTVWGIADKKIYLLDVVRDRFPYPDLCARAAALARTRYSSRMPDTILIENKASGQSLLQSLHRDGIYSVKPVTPDTDKLTRMSSQTSSIANGAVYIPREAPWLADFLQELMAFPRGRHDDQVDSVSQALNWFADSNDVPGILEYYRKLVEEKNVKPDDDVIVTMRHSNPNVNVFQPAKDNPIFIGADGLFRIPMRHARNLHPPEWIRVEES